ncbi:oxidation resistance protein 1-like [Pollicipes pollicipes]|uniref:oxidation resistance protein 1-like n=1 Tax=Pollicipes pollicipes TaxID=41117 RepID=UPI00188557F7|nr:oxidation resistance protein 1-like [Pollicipes pollicipes]
MDVMEKKLAIPLDLFVRSIVEDERTTRDERRRNPAQLPRMIRHKVQLRETVPSIAARFDCHPGEIVEVNRLGSRLIFPGQVLVVPCHLPEDQLRQAEERSAAANEEEHATGGARPRLRFRSYSTPGNRSAFLGALPHKLRDGYIHVEAKLITGTTGVVTGTLFFTPNRVKFDPHVSHPLVVEMGMEAYTVEVPVALLVSAAYFKDLAHHGRASRRMRPSVAAEPADGAALSDQSEDETSPTADDEDSGSGGTGRDRTVVNQPGADASAAGAVGADDGAPHAAEDGAAVADAAGAASGAPIASEKRPSSPSTGETCRRR